MSDKHTKNLLNFDCEGPAGDKQWVDDEGHVLRCDEGGADVEEWCLLCHAYAIAMERDQLRAERDQLQSLVDALRKRLAFYAFPLAVSLVEQIDEGLQAKHQESKL